MLQCSNCTKDQCFRLFGHFVSKLKWLNEMHTFVNKTILNVAEFLCNWNWQRVGNTARNFYKYSIIESINDFIFKCLNRRRRRAVDDNISKVRNDTNANRKFPWWFWFFLLLIQQIPFCVTRQETLAYNQEHNSCVRHFSLTLKTTSNWNHTSYTGCCKLGWLNFARFAILETCYVCAK